MPNSAPDGERALRFELDPPIDDNLTRALIEVWAEVTNAGGAVGFVPPVTAADVGPLARTSLAKVRSAESHLIVAWLDDEVAGFLFLEHRPGPIFRHWAELKRLQVRPTLQGRGLGAALLREALERGRNLGLEQLRARVRGGTGYEDFYRAHGFEEVARVPDAIRVAPGDDREEIYLIARL